MYLQNKLINVMNMQETREDGFEDFEKKLNDIQNMMKNKLEASNLKQMEDKVDKIEQTQTSIDNKS